MSEMIFQRYEFKYLLDSQQLCAVLSAMAPYTQPDVYGHSSIRNLYLDTPDFRLIRRSLERPVYKEKVRIRSYGPAKDHDPVFVELKKKYCSVVYKRRTTMVQRDVRRCLEGSGLWPDTQIGREVAYTVDFYQDLQPVVFLSYERDAYAGIRDQGFRVTFDREIRYRCQELTLDSDPWGIALLPPGKTLMELKVVESMPLWMAHTLSALGVFKTSFSKYGAAYQDLLAAGVRGGLKYA